MQRSQQSFDRRCTWRCERHRKLNGTFTFIRSIPDMSTKDSVPRRDETQLFSKVDFELSEVNGTVAAAR